MYAICGVGNWGTKLLREFSQTQEFKYFCCKSSEKADLINQEFENLARASLEQICADDQITDVLVSVPIKNLAEFSRKLLLSNKNIFLEKPGSQSLNEIKKLQDIKSSSFVHVNYKFLFHEKILELKRNVAAGEKIVRFNFEWFKYGSFGNDIKLNLLTHILSILEFVFPEEKFYMEYLTLQKDSLLVSCFSDNIRGRILICRKSQNRKFHLSVENSNKTIKKLDLNSQNVLKKSADCFINKTNQSFRLEFASKVLNNLENIR